MDKLLLFFGASADVLPYAMDYMGITLSGFLFLSFSLAANNMIRAEGRPRAAMYPMIIGAVINIVLDGILMTGLNMDGHSSFSANNAAMNWCKVLCMVIIIG